jgi:glyoxylase-like metal-dependent hydrolase (beta-lactamase superfamily II)
VRLIAPDIAYTDSLTFDGGDLTIELLHTPGHTPDHTVVWIPALRTLLAGDAVERPWPYVHGAADVPIMRATLARLLALGVEQLAICHGGVSDPALIAANIAYFDQMERRCRAALAATPGLAERAAATDEEALEATIDWPYAEALREVGTTPEQVDTFYQKFHQSAIRAMLGWLATQR